MYWESLVNLADKTNFNGRKVMRRFDTNVIGIARAVRSKGAAIVTNRCEKHESQIARGLN